MIAAAGMHRSGTSALAELLAALGLDLGDPAGLYAADRWNERGYFEQRDILDLNSEIVCGLPRTRHGITRWLAQLAYLRMPGRAQLGARARRRGARMRRLAEKYAGRLVKDPRFCLTLPDWLELGAIESLVVCVRHPGEVADSLWQRQRIPRALGLRFWDYHVAALLSASARVRSAFVEYEALLCGDARTLLRLDVFFGLGLSAREREKRCSDVLQAGLRHSRPRAALPPRTRQLYGELLERCAEPR